MRAIRLLALAGLPIAGAACAGGGPLPSSPATTSPGHFMPLAVTSRAAPPVRQSTVMAYHPPDPAPPMLGGELAADPRSGGMLFFLYSPWAPSCGGLGGCPVPRDPSGTRYSQTWMWDGQHFAMAHPSRAPASPVLLISDERISRTLAIDTAGYLWAWTGSPWRRLASGRGPPAVAAAVYDPALGDVAVFGTRTETGSPTSQTWLWNGSRWSLSP